MSTNTIHVSISIDTETDPLEFTFLSEKLTWSNLVQFIESSSASLEPPVTLYYLVNDTVESLENQEQLELLLAKDNIKGLRFYGQKDLAIESLYVLSGNAFLRLGELVDQHKEVVASSRRLARWVGILASFIAQDTQESDFDYEFKVLEKLIERKTRKDSRRSAAANGEEEDAGFIVVEEDEEEEEEDPREVFFGRRGGRRHHGGPFGGRGGRHHHGPHGLFGPPREELFGGRAGPCGGRGGFFGDKGEHHGLKGEGFFGHGRGGFPGGPHGHHLFGEEFGARGGRGGRHHHFGGRGGDHHHHFGSKGHHGPFGAPGEEEFGPAGPFGRGPLGDSHGRHHHPFFFGGKHQGGKHEFNFSSSGDEEKKRGGKCGDKKDHRHHHPYGHYRGGFSSSDESGEDDIRALKFHLLKKHFKLGGRRGGFENHFHFAA